MNISASSDSYYMLGTRNSSSAYRMMQKVFCQRKIRQFCKD
jgi:hypothetical protein